MPVPVQGARARAMAEWEAGQGGWDLVTFRRQQVNHQGHFTSGVGAGTRLKQECGAVTATGRDLC